MEEAPWVSVYLAKNPPAQQRLNLAQTQHQGHSAQPWTLGARGESEQPEAPSFSLPGPGHLTLECRPLLAAASCGLLWVFLDFSLIFLVSHSSLCEFVKPLYDYFLIFYVSSSLYL